MIPVRVLCIGETGRAGALVGFAKNLARAAFSAGILSREWKLPGDISISVNNILSAKISKVVITAKAGALYHGVFSYLQAGFPGAVPPGETVSEDEKQPERLTYSFNFLTLNKDGYETTGFGPSLVFFNQFGTMSNYPWIPFPCCASGKKAGCFSGEMRKVVQVLAAKNKAIFYDYHHSKTHGIYVIQQTGKRLVVEISGGGIRYWKLNASYKGASSLQTAYQLGSKESPLPYVPSAIDAAPEEAKYAAVTGLSMAEIYSGSEALSDEIGWAFSLSGHEAQTVVTRSHDFMAPGMASVGEYQKAYRYLLAFSYNSESEELSVSASLEESEWFWYGWLQNNIRIPVYTLCGPAHKRLTPISLLAQVRPKTETYTFPFFVFYDGDTPCVFRYQVGAQIDTSLPDESYPNTGSDIDARGIKHNIAYNRDFYSDGVESVWDVQLKESSERFDFGVQRKKKRTAYTTKVSQYEGDDYPYIINPIGGTGTPEYLSLDNVFLCKDTVYDGADWEDYLFSFIIPFFEREGFFLYQKTYDYYSYDTVFRSMSVAGRKLHRSYLASYWGIADSYGSQSFGSSSFFAIANRVTASTCSFGPDLAPQESLSPSYLIVSTSGLNQVGEQTLSMYEICAPFGGSFLADTVKTYTYTGIVKIPSMLNTEVEPPSPPTATEIAAFYYPGVESKVDMEFHINPLTGDLFDDNSSCEFSTPWWMVATLDTTSSKVGFISKYPAVSNSAIQLIGNDAHYNLCDFIGEGAPAQLFGSGFFGVPFPDQLDNAE